MNFNVNNTISIKIDAAYTCSVPAAQLPTAWNDYIPYPYKKLKCTNLEQILLKMFICIKIECVLLFYIYGKSGVNKRISFYRRRLSPDVTIETIVASTVKLCTEAM